MHPSRMPLVALERTGRWSTVSLAAAALLACCSCAAGTSAAVEAASEGEAPPARRHTAGRLEVGIEGAPGGAGSQHETSPTVPRRRLVRQESHHGGGHAHPLGGVQASMLGRVREAGDSKAENTTDAAGLVPGEVL